MIKEIKTSGRASKSAQGIWTEVTNADGSLWAQLLHFDEGSMYGINGGKISKLEIRDAVRGKHGTQVFYRYDRGLDIKSSKKEVVDFYNEIIRKYN